MATLYFKVSSDYDEVIRLRQECEKLEAQLKKMDVNKAPAAARALETQLASTRQQMMGLVTEAAKAGAVMERDFKNGIYNASQTVNNLSANITSQRGVVRQLQNELTLLKEKYRETVKSGGDTTGISEQIKAQTAKLREQKDVLFGLTQQQAEARLSVKRLKDEYTAFKEEAGETVEANEKMSMSLTKVLGIIGGTTALKNFVSELINVRGEFQQLEIAFSTMLKSKEKANQLMSELVDIAAKTPFDLQGVASSAKQMLAYGSSAENVGNELVMLGNVAAGVGSQLSEIAYLYGTLRTQGRAYAVDIRQFAGRGIPIYEELAKVLGVTKDEVSSLVSEGKVGFKEVEQAFKNMTSESGIYYNLMEEQSKSLTGQLSNLGDAWDTMLNEIGKNTQGIASAGITGLKGLIEHYETVGKIIIGLIATYGTYKTVLFVTKIAQDTLTARMELAIIVTKAQAVAQAALNTVMQANPYVLVATMLAGLITTLWAFHDGATAASAAQDRLNKSQAEFTEREEERKRKVEELIRVIQDKNETELAQIQAYDELKRYSPALAEAYTREQLATLDLAKANKTLNKERDKNQYDEITQNIQQAEQAIQRLRKQMENASKSPNSASEVSFITGQLRSAEADLQQWKKALDELNKAKESLKKPTKLDIQVAEREYQDSKMKLDYMSGFMIALKKEVEGTMKLHVDGSPAEKDTTSIIKDIEKRIKEIDKVPMSVEQMKVRDDLSEIHDYMLRWKNEASKNGTFTIPIQFQLKLSSLQGDTNQKKSKFNYLTGQYESEKPELFKDAYKNAEKSWSNAKNTYNQLKNSAKSTKEEVIKAKEAMETAEKAFKELGGDPQASKKQNKVESQAIKREEAIRKQTETLKALEQKQSLDRAREAVDMENQIEQARIDAMADGGDKILAQRELNNKKEMQAIDRAKEEYIQKEIQRQKEIFEATEDLKAKKNPKYKKRSFDSSSVSVDTSAFDILKENTDKRQVQEDLNAQREAMNAYLAEYGTYMQKRQAIIEQYQDKINKAATEGEKLTLGKQRDSILSGIDEQANRTTSAVSQLFGDMKDKTLKDLEAINIAGQKALEFLKSGQWDEQKGKELGITKENFNVWSNDPEKIKAISDALVNNRKAADDLQPAYKKVAAGIKDAFDAGDDSKKLEEALARIRDGMNEIMQVGSFLSGTLSSLDDAFGNDAFTSIADGINTAMDAVNSTMQGAQAGAMFGPIGASAGAAIGLVSSLATSIAKIHDKKNEKNIERLQDQIDVLDDSYNKLARSIEKAYSTDASDLIDQQNELLEQQKLLIQQQILEEKNKKKTDDGRIKEWEQQLKDIDEQIQDNAEKAQEAIAGISFDSFRNNFLDSLTDMDAKVEDLADNFEEYLKKAILNGLMADKYDSQIKELYEKWTAYGKDGLTEAEVEQLRKDYKDIANAMIADRDSLAQIYGWESESSKEQQSATSRGFGTEMTHEDAGELSGRFTAVYESNLRIEAAEQQQTVAITELRGSISALTAQASGMYNIADETRTILAKSYLELQQIRENTSEIIKPIKQMQADMAEVKRNTSRL